MQRLTHFLLLNKASVSIMILHHNHNDVKIEKIGGNIEKALL